MIAEPYGDAMGMAFRLQINDAFFDKDLPGGNGGKVNQAFDGLGLLFGP